MGQGIKGVLQDGKGEPVVFAAVALFKATDSALVKSTTSDENGRFQLDAVKGKYYLQATFLSFEPKTVDAFQYNGANLDLGIIKMKGGAKDLDEFTVKSEKMQMEMKLDKRVFNINSDLNNAGANAAEVLDNIPSVGVDVEGNVSLRGSENVRILIDGKPSGLIGLSSADALRQLQGDLIERIEVITNPSARYDAEGEVGIINIVLKKEKREGVNGGITATVGYPDNYGLSANITVRRKNFSVFSSYGIRYRYNPGYGLLYQEFTYPDTSWTYTKDEVHRRGGLSHNARLGTDLYLSDKSVLTISGLFKDSDGENDWDFVFTDFDLNGNQTQVVNRTELENEAEFTYEVDMDYRKTFKKKDQLLTITSRYTRTGEDELSDLTQASDDPSIIPITQRTTINDDEERFLFQADYVHPVGEDGKFETGIKFRFRDVTTLYGLQDLVSDSWVENENFTDELKFSSDVYAAYMMYGNKIKDFSYQLGLRYEESDLRTELVKSNQLYNRKFPGFFPSAHLSYEYKKEKYVQISYSRRISRPRYWWLMPFYGFGDNRNLFAGNPNLDPEFTHSSEVGLLNKLKNGSVLGSVYYRYTVGHTERILISDSVGFTTRIPVNLGTEEAYGVELSGSYEPKNWWTMNGNINYYRAITDGSYQGIQYGADTWAYSGKFTTKFKMKRKFSLQTSIDYRSPRISPQGKVLARYNWDASAALDILKGNGTLTFNARDMLNTRLRRSVSRGENFYADSEFQWRSRQFTLTFNYRINQKKKRDGERGFDDGDGGM